MSSVATGTFLGLLFVIWIGVLILPTVFFILSQQRALSKCSPGNQTMSPGLVWLQIIPVFGFIWQFFVVTALANSLGAEFRARGVQEEEKPGQGVGLAMCITRICVVIPILGFFSLIASIVLWIIYWVKITGFSRTLDYAPAAYGQSPYGTPPYGAPTYGTPGYGVSYQPPYQAPYGQQRPSVSPQATAPVGTPHEADPSTVLLTDSEPVVSACASCGTTLSPDSAFCHQCGAKAG
jgi:hypothetical protein